MILIGFLLEEYLNYIVNIHLAQIPYPDKRIWSESEHGIMMVKSAYLMVIKNNITGFNNGVLNQLWSVIWSAKVAPKVQPSGGNFCMVSFLSCLFCEGEA